MRKLFLLFAIVFIASVCAKSQVYLGGSFSILHEKSSETTMFTIAPEIGYEFNEKWAVGGEIGYTYLKEAKATANSFSFTPYARFFFFNSKIIRLFADGFVGLSTTKVKPFDAENGFQIGARPGIAIKISNHFSFVTTYGFLGYRDSYKGNSVSGINLGTEDLNIGFHYIF